MQQRYAGVEPLNEDDLAELAIALFTCMNKGEGSVLTQQQWVSSQQKFLTSVGAWDAPAVTAEELLLFTARAVKQYEEMDTNGVCAFLCTMRCPGARPPHV